MMGRFNLLDEPWISVLDGKTGEKRDVSLLEFFQNGGKYQTLAGDTETQNFAVMRFLLSIIQTVFSRFDFEGAVLPGVELDERWVQTESVDEDDLDEYCDAVSECWDRLYLNGSFPDVVSQYLEKWRDRFFLFDEVHPFYQVNQQEMNDIMELIPQKSQPTTIYGKNLNRTISESENKIALFSPIVQTGSGKRSKKDIMTSAQLVRWLITFQGYSGLADKVSLVNTVEKQRPSKGWLFDLGGVFLQGSNVFETLVMNYIPEFPANRKQLCGRIQNPCWEADGSLVVKRIYSGKQIDNLAELYTNWSRSIYIDPMMDMADPVEINIVKLPEIEHTENSIEPMTLWRWNENGPNKNHFTPKKHNAEQALWRSFGIIAMNPSSGESSRQFRPGIYGQYRRLAKVAGSRWTNLTGVSMADDGNATSWIPVDEISDSFMINDLVIADEEPDGWIVRINDVVETTKEVVSTIFKSYLRGICEIRDLKVTSPMDPNAAGFIEREIAEMYALIDSSFKEWICSIEPGDSKEEKIKSWNTQLRRQVLNRGEELYESSMMRDLTGIEKDNKIVNIATKYWQFVYRVNNKLGKGGAA